MARKVLKLTENWMKDLKMAKLVERTSYNFKTNVPKHAGEGGQVKIMYSRAHKFRHTHIGRCLGFNGVALLTLDLITTFERFV